MWPVAAHFAVTVTVLVSSEIQLIPLKELPCNVAACTSPECAALLSRVLMTFVHWFLLLFLQLFCRLSFPPVLQTASTFMTASGARINLINGAQVCNVFIAVSTNLLCV